MPDAADASLPDLDLPLGSTPNQIRCGDSLCAINAYCCLSTQDGSLATGVTFDSCRDSFCPLRRECDETADCNAGQICCYSVVTGPPVQTCGPIVRSACKNR
jgi:hypothetical protein